MIFLSLLIAIVMNSSVITDYFSSDAIAQSFSNQPTVDDEVVLEQVAGIEEVIAIPNRVYTTKSMGVMLSAPTSFVMDVSTGDVLWEQNADKVVPIASITKLASVATLLNIGVNLDDVVTIQYQDQRPEGGNRHVYLGEKITVNNLLHSVLIASDNEALMVLVRYTGLSEEEFVQRVNQWADDNNLSTLHIADPTGLNEKNVASARDVARLAQIVLSDKQVLDIAKNSQYNFVVENNKRVVKLKNTNRLLKSPFSVVVGKTGFTEQAGYNLVTISNVNNYNKVITVVLGADSIDNRFQDTKALLYWISENYRW